MIESKPGQKYIVRIESQLNSAEPVNSGPSEEAERQVAQTAANGLWICSTAALFAIIVYMRRRWEGEGEIKETKKQKENKNAAKGIKTESVMEIADPSKARKNKNRKIKKPGKVKVPKAPKSKKQWRSLASMKGR